jgi:hypothetical protein
MTSQLERSTLINPVTVDPNRNMKSEKCCSQLSTVHSLKDTWHLGRQMSHLSVQTKLKTVSTNLHYYVQKQVQLLSLLSMNKCMVFLQFLDEVSTVIFYYLFHQHYLHH